MEPNNNNDQANQCQQTDISKSIESAVLPTMMELGGDEANASSPRAAETAQMPSLNATATNGGPGSFCDGTLGAPPYDNGHQNAAVTIAAAASLPKTTKALGEPANSGVAGGGGVDSLDQPSDDVEESHQAEELVVKEECIFPQDEYMEDEEVPHSHPIHPNQI